jgi:hypothetical protein
MALTLISTPSTIPTQKRESRYPLNHNFRNFIQLINYVDGSDKEKEEEDKQPDP